MRAIGWIEWNEVENFGGKMWADGKLLPTYRVDWAPAEPTTDINRRDMLEGIMPLENGLTASVFADQVVETGIWTISMSLYFYSQPPEGGDFAMTVEHGPHSRRVPPGEAWVIPDEPFKDPFGAMGWTHYNPCDHDDIIAKLRDWSGLRIVDKREEFLNAG